MKLYHKCMCQNRKMLMLQCLTGEKNEMKFKKKIYVQCVAVLKT